MASDPHQSRKFGWDRQTILCYTADRSRFTFCADAIRVPSAQQTRYQDWWANPTRTTAAEEVERPERRRPHLTGNQSWQ